MNSKTKTSSKKTLSKIMAALLAVGMTAVCFTGCQSSSSSSSSSSSNSTTAESSKSISGSITGSGSSALLPLAQDAADKFKEKNPDVSITMNAGGSGTGLKQVADGSVDLGNSDVFAEEKLDKDTSKDLVDHKVCAVTMAAIVNNEVGSKVSSLTKEQLISIFSGKTTNWKEVGGPDTKILLVTRPDSSGTRALFTKWALDGNEESSKASYLETDNSGELLQTVKDNKGAIGYLALSYLVNNTDVKSIAIDNAEPTLENTYNGKYPVWGYEHMYTKGEPNDVTKAFLDFITSDDYGKSMERQGYAVASKITKEH